MMVTWARHMMESGLRVAYWTGEQSIHEIAKMVAAQRTGISISRLSMKDLTKEEEGMLRREEHIPGHMVIYDHSKFDTHWLFMEARNGVDVFFIDNLQKAAHSRAERVANERHERRMFVCMARLLREEAKRHDICIVAASHVRRESVGGGQVERDIQDIGDFACYADAVLSVAQVPNRRLETRYPSLVRDRRAIVHMLKCGDGSGCWDINLRFDAALKKFND
jgi:predicted ATP-dependent serine protease